MELQELEWSQTCLACFTPFIKMAFLAVSDRLVSSQLKIFLGGIPSAVISYVMVAELVVVLMGQRRPAVLDEIGLPHREILLESYES